MGSHLLPGQTFNGLIRIAHLLGLQVGGFIHLALLQPLFHQVQVQVLIQEEIVDLRDFVELLQGHAPADGLIHGEHPLVGALSNQVQQLFGALLRHALHPQGIAADFCPADRLHQCLFHIHANGHHFAGSLHLGAQVPLAINELVEGPLGQLGHDIVQCRLEAGTGLAGHGVLHFVQRIADGNLSSTLGNRIPGGLAGQGRRTAYPRVHLDNRILEGIRIQGELAVAAALHPKRRNNIQCCPAEHLIFLIRQGQGRGNHDGVAGMHTHRVNILHGADSHHIAQAVPHNFKLDFLPAGDALFHKNLGNGGKSETVFRRFSQLLHIVADTAAAAA